jgi:HicB family
MIAATARLRKVAGGYHPMSVLTLRIPEGKHERLKSLAKARGISLNKLIDELSTVALASMTWNSDSALCRHVDPEKQALLCWTNWTAPFHAARCSMA